MGFSVADQMRRSPRLMGASRVIHVDTPRAPALRVEAQLALCVSLRIYGGLSWCGGNVSGTRPEGGWVGVPGPWALGPVAPRSFPRSTFPPRVCMRRPREPAAAQDKGCPYPCPRPLPLGDSVPCQPSRVCSSPPLPSRTCLGARASAAPADPMAWQGVAFPGPAVLTRPRSRPKQLPGSRVAPRGSQRAEHYLHTSVHVPQVPTWRWRSCRRGNTQSPRGRQTVAPASRTPRSVVR